MRKSGGNVRMLETTQIMYMNRQSLIFSFHTEKPSKGLVQKPELLQWSTEGGVVPQVFEIWTMNGHIGNTIN